MFANAWLKNIYLGQIKQTKIYGPNNLSIYGIQTNIITNICTWQIKKHCKTKTSTSNVALTVELKICYQRTIVHILCFVYFGNFT